MTGWKQALFLGGAVLLLAACDRATGPTTTQIREGKSAANSLMLSPSSETTTTSDSTETLDLCRNPVIISSGRTEEETISSDCLLLTYDY